MRSRWAGFALLLLLIGAAGFMIGAMRQESATVDETVFLGAGWSYWQGHRYRLNPEHPPLAQLIAALPARLMGARLPALADAILRGRVLAGNCERWDLRRDREPLSTAELFPRGPSFYHYPFDEQSLFGGLFVYGGENDAERLLFWGRMTSVALTLLTGWLVFLWTRNLRSAPVGLFAAAMFLFNPVVLAYGHIVQSDIGLALTFPLAVCCLARWVEAPGARAAVWAGLATGLALATKFTAVILAPTFVVLWALHWRRPAHWKQGLIIAALAWGVILLLYAPHWVPAPPIDPATATKLGVPRWFVALRQVLIPPEYFKGLALTLQHAAGGHESYLNGVWSERGWWYYFPAAFAMKSPLPFLVFTAAGIVAAIRRRRQLRLGEQTAWVGALVFLGCSMFSRANLGVRHILPVYPLLAVGAACALDRWTENRRKPAGWAAGIVSVAGLAVVVRAYPCFIPYMNPLAGGTERGYERLLDSNYDWGQDVIRLRKFLDERGMERIYLQYFGTQPAIEYYRIANDFVDSDQARRIERGWLVVSAQALMRPEWRWLRESHRPVARVGYTLFVYEIGNVSRDETTARWPRNRPTSQNQTAARRSFPARGSPLAAAGFPGRG